jgi:F0F1-type ATP synthase membrane subunit b/b'
MTEDADSADREFEYYERLLADYERDMKEIQQMSESIEEDVIKEEDAINEVKQHIEEERKIEMRLGNRYIAKIQDEEAGSTLGEINQKHHP